MRWYEVAPLVLVTALHLWRVARDRTRRRTAHRQPGSRARPPRYDWLIFAMVLVTAPDWAASPLAALLHGGGAANAADVERAKAVLWAALLLPAAAWVLWMTVEDRRRFAARMRAKEAAPRLVVPGHAAPLGTSRKPRSG